MNLNEYLIGFKIPHITDRISPFSFIWILYICPENTLGNQGNFNHITIILFKKMYLQILFTMCWLFGRLHVLYWHYSTEILLTKIFVISCGDHWIGWKLVSGHYSKPFSHSMSYSYNQMKGLCFCITSHKMELVCCLLLWPLLLTWFNFNPSMDK